MLIAVFCAISSTIALTIDFARAALVTLCVVYAYVVLLVRGFGEIREVRDLRRRTAWLRDAIASASASKA
ncbi:MAG: hypothetical protein ACK4KV_06025 [Rhodocyclaceae bacterium]